MIWIEVLSFPVFSYKASSLKVACYILMFFFSLDFTFHSCSSISPFFHCLSQFLLSTFFSNHSVLIFKPNLFNLLFGHIISWIIVKVIRFAFNSILCFKYYWFTCRIKILEWMLVDWSFFFFEHWLSLGSNIA